MTVAIENATQRPVDLEELVGSVEHSGGWGVGQDRLVGEHGGHSPGTSGLSDGQRSPPTAGA